MQNISKEEESRLQRKAKNALSSRQSQNRSKLIESVHTTLVVIEGESDPTKSKFHYFPETLI